MFDSLLENLIPIIGMFALVVVLVELNFRYKSKPLVAISIVIMFLYGISVFRTYENYREPIEEYHEEVQKLDTISDTLAEANRILNENSDYMLSNGQVTSINFRGNFLNIYIKLDDSVYVQVTYDQEKLHLNVIEAEIKEDGIPIDIFEEIITNVKSFDSIYSVGYFEIKTTFYLENINSADLDEIALHDRVLASKKRLMKIKCTYNNSEGKEVSTNFYMLEN